MKNNIKPIIIFVVTLVIVLALFIPSMVKQKQELKQIDVERQLIEDGKYTSAHDVMLNFIDALHAEDIKKAKGYLSKDCKIYNKDHKPCTFDKYLTNIDTTTSYKYEERGNSVGDEETYVVRWNNETEVQTIMLRKTSNSERVYYEIITLMIS